MYTKLTRHTNKRNPACPRCALYGVGYAISPN